MAEATLLIITRDAWGARAPQPTQSRPDGQPVTVPASQRKGFVLHWPGDESVPADHNDCPAFMRNIQNYHMDSKGWSDGAYSFCLCPHGGVYELRGWVWDQFATAPGVTDHYTVCVWVPIGGGPTDIQLDHLRLLVQMGRDRGAGLMIKPHNFFQVTACPGPALVSWALAFDGQLFKQEPQVVEEAMAVKDEYVLYKDARYQNVWLVGGGGAVHMSPKLADFYRAQGVVLIEDTHDQTLEGLIDQSGITEDNLVK